MILSAIGLMFLHGIFYLLIFAIFLPFWAIGEALIMVPCYIIGCVYIFSILWTWRRGTAGERKQNNKKECIDPKYQKLQDEINSITLKN
jgi:hypothetical protein